jgi:hypothetical protein
LTQPSAELDNLDLNRPMPQTSVAEASWQLYQQPRTRGI